MSDLSKRVAELSWARDPKYVDKFDDELQTMRLAHQLAANKIADEQEYRKLVALKAEVS